jgi:hypothetical protein
MDAKEKQLKFYEQRESGAKRVLVIWTACFILMPFILWNHIVRLNRTGMIFFCVAYVIGGAVIFALFIWKYNKAVKEHQLNSPRQP